MQNLTAASTEPCSEEGSHDPTPTIDLVRARTMLLDERARMLIEGRPDYSDLRQAIQIRDQSIRTIAHDLKSPLTVIRLCASMLGNSPSTAGHTQEQRNNLLKKILDSTDRLVDMTNNLQQLAHVTVGEPEDLDCQSIDLVDVAREIVDLQQIAATRHELRLELPAAPVIGEWDRSRLVCAVTNLVENAIKYSPDGGEINVRVVREQDEIGDWALLVVQDCGMGIPLADQPHIFELSHRGSNAGSLSGTGVGLASARQVIERHGGTILLQSEEGKGSAFTVRLPLH